MQNLTAADFYKPTTFNSDTRNQIWMSQIQDSHDNFCNCWHPFAHLLASIFPPDHKDRNSTIQEILDRDYKELCHSGGTEERNHGMVGDSRPADTEGVAGPGEEGEHFIKDEELEELIAAGEDASTR